MSMVVNLLPWRHTGRQRRQHYRIGVMISVIVLLISGLWGGRALLHQQVVLLQKQGYEREKQHNKLQGILHDRLEVQQQDGSRCQGEEQEKERQRRLSRWGNILCELATHFPEDSWLGRISWQSGILRLEGYTSDIVDIEKIEGLLKQLPGDFQVSAGPVSYQAEKGLEYVFMMKEVGGSFVPL